MDGYGGARGEFFYSHAAVGSWRLGCLSESRYVCEEQHQQHYQQKDKRKRRKLSAHTKKQVEDKK